MDKELETAVQEIRSRALGRISSESAETESEEGNIRKERTVVRLQPDEEELEILNELLAEHRNNERKKMALDRKRLEIERQNVMAARDKR